MPVRGGDIIQRGADFEPTDLPIHEAGDLCRSELRKMTPVEVAKLVLPKVKWDSGPTYGVLMEVFDDRDSKELNRAVDQAKAELK